MFSYECFIWFSNIDKENVKDFQCYSTIFVRFVIFNSSFICKMCHAGYILVSFFLTLFFILASSIIENYAFILCRWQGNHIKITKSHIFFTSCQPKKKNEKKKTVEVECALHKDLWHYIVFRNVLHFFYKKNLLLNISIRLYDTLH